MCKFFFIIRKRRVCRIAAVNHASVVVVARRSTSQSARVPDVELDDALIAIQHESRFVLEILYLRSATRIAKNF